jgi:hypothetical protein
MNLSRRRFFTGLGVVLAAPVIVRAASIMPVRPIDPLANLTALIEQAMNRMVERYAQEISDIMWRPDLIGLGEFLTETTATQEPRIAICGPHFYRQISTDFVVA